MISTTATVEKGVAQSLAALEIEGATRVYRGQNEFFHLDRFLSPSTVEALVADVQQVRPELNRNYIPGHKRGGASATTRSSRRRQQFCRCTDLRR